MELCLGEGQGRRRGIDDIVKELSRTGGWRGE